MHDNLPDAKFNQLCMTKYCGSNYSTESEEYSKLNSSFSNANEPLLNSVRADVFDNHVGEWSHRNRFEQATLLVAVKRKPSEYKTFFNYTMKNSIILSKNTIEDKYSCVQRNYDVEEFVVRKLRDKQLKEIAMHAKPSSSDHQVPTIANKGLSYEFGENVINNGTNSSMSETEVVKKREVVRRKHNVSGKPPSHRQHCKVVETRAKKTLLHVRKVVKEDDCMSISSSEGEYVSHLKRKMHTYRLYYVLEDACIAAIKVSSDEESFGEEANLKLEMPKKKRSKSDRIALEMSHLDNLSVSSHMSTDGIPQIAYFPFTEHNNFKKMDFLSVLKATNNEMSLSTAFDSDAFYRGVSTRCFDSDSKSRDVNGCGFFPIAASPSHPEIEIEYCKEESMVTFSPYYTKSVHQVKYPPIPTSEVNTESLDECSMTPSATSHRTTSKLSTSLHQVVDVIEGHPVGEEDIFLKKVKVMDLENLEEILIDTIQKPDDVRPYPREGMDKDGVLGELVGVHHSPCRLYPPDILSTLAGFKSKVKISSNFSTTLHLSEHKNFFVGKGGNNDSVLAKQSSSIGRSVAKQKYVESDGGEVTSTTSNTRVNQTSPATVSVEERTIYILKHPASQDPLFESLTALLHGQHFDQLNQQGMSSNLYEVKTSPSLYEENFVNHDALSKKAALNFVIGLAHYKQGNYSTAKLNLESCQNFSMSASPSCKADIGLCHIYLGDCEFTTQHYKEAAIHYSKATQLYSPLNVAIFFRMIPPSVSVIYAKCGSALRHAQKMVDGVMQYKLAIDKAVTDKDRLSSNTSLGNLYQSLGENASALTHYEESIKLSEKLEDYVSLGWAHGNLGNAYLGLFQKDKALHHLQKSLNLTVEHEPTPQAIGRTYNNLGTAYQSLGDLDKAQEYYDLALNQAVYGNDTAGQARVYGNIGNVFMLRKNYKEAIPHYTEVLRLSKDRSTLSTAYHNRGCAYYEWAEAKMEALSTAEGQQCYFHGPGFEADSRPVVIPEIASYYRQGSDDLQKVVHYHEENLDNIKGSSKGLNLSISLFETNSRTFHRLQDCLVRLGDYTQALLVAEQSRARTLGELMLKRKGWSLPQLLSSPLQFEQVVATVANRTHPVLYLSYTGARLLGWVFMPQDGDVQMNMFEVPLKDDQFDGKSLDYHLRYSLTETLVERSFEMYRSVDYNSESSEPVKKLHQLIAEPLCKILWKHSDFLAVNKIAVISDSYTALVPLSSLCKNKSFLGDTIRFQLMPSLLCMSVLDSLPDANVVRLPSDAQNMCIAGNPTIPQFTYNDEVWNLGKLPHAKWEAEWVAHIIKTTPILEEQATKSAILMRIQSAKVIHLATHGSASAGFMAFGAMVSVGVGQDVAVAAESVLLYPEDVERLNISPALVVLSSCDSGRGAVKADGIQGMARAFILAGAQAVLTTLWRVPDESASIFMQFFYQFMTDGFESTRALQKAILSIRCFSKYSQYIHWSGYQLTGRDVHFECSIPNTDEVLKQRLGVKSVFPRLPIIKDLESALVKDPCYPTDVQVLKGCPGVKSSEVVIDFIHVCHQHFSGGVFWINCKNVDFVSAAIHNIETVLHTSLVDLELSEFQPVLLVLDDLTTLPGTEQRDDFSKPLLKLMSSRHVHCVVLYKHYEPTDQLVRAVDQKLLRGCKIHIIDPLTMIQSTQRTVYTLQRKVDLAPNNSDQQILEKLAEFTAGSPILVDIISQLILFQLKRKDLVTSGEDSHLDMKLREFAKSINLDDIRQFRELKDQQYKLRDISQNMKLKIPSVSELSDEQRDEWDTTSVYDSWESIHDIINSFQLCTEEETLLYCLAIFGCCPIPVSLVTALSSSICSSSGQPHLTSTLLRSLASKNFILTYPSPVVLYPSMDPTSEGEKFVYLPQYVASFLWKSLDNRDRLFALGTTCHTLSAMPQHLQCSLFLVGVASQLLHIVHLHCDLVGRVFCKEVFKLILTLIH